MTPAAAGKPAPDRGEITNALDVLFDRGDIVEVRALFTRGRKRVDAGYFDGDHRDDLSGATARLNKDGASVYVTLNTIDPQLLGRYANRIEQGAGATTSDANVIRRRWLLHDFDPVRPKDTSSTDAQVEASKALARECFNALRSEGWPDPISAESGNGAHLLYPIDLPNDSETTAIIKASLQGLAKRFDTDGVKIDQSVFNAARIVKLYGTVANKGDHTLDTPWRVSRIMNAPKRETVVTLDQLLALAPSTPNQGSRPNGSQRYGEFDLDAFLGRLGIGYKQDPYNGRERYKLDHCPFNPDHGFGEAAVFRGADGALGFKCQHSSCADKHWGDLRELLDGRRSHRDSATAGASGDQNSNGKQGAESPGVAVDDTDRAAFERLAKMSRADYDRVREAEGKALKIRVATLDAEVTKARGETVEEQSGRGRPFTFAEPDPWPDPVDGARVLDTAYESVKLHMHMSDDHAAAAVLWAAHTHVYDAFAHTPRLLITAPVEDSGKTLLLSHLVGSLVRRPLPLELMKPAPFFRLAEEFKPCFLIDECDVFIKEDSDLLAAINNGWEPHGGVPRCTGEDFEVRIFSTHTPVALGGVKLHKKLPSTTWSRSIIITLERATDVEITEHYDRRVHKQGLLELSRKLARWCSDHKEDLRKANPVLPGGAHNRRADKWRCLFAIAEVAGGVWPERAKCAYLAEESAEGGKTSIAKELLEAIREVLKPIDHVIATEDLLRRLCALPDAVWGDFNFKERDPDRRGLQSRQLSNLLRDFKVKPGTVRIGERTPKGYVVKDLSALFRRYTPKLAATPQQPNNGAASHESYPQQNNKSVADRTSRKPAPHSDCGGVAARNTPPLGDTHMIAAEIVDQDGRGGSAGASHTPPGTSPPKGPDPGVESVSFTDNGPDNLGEPTAEDMAPGLGGFVSMKPSAAYLVLVAARAEGFALRLGPDGTCFFCAPKGAITAELRSDLKLHKPALLTLLAAGA